MTQLIHYILLIFCIIFINTIVEAKFLKKIKNNVTPDQKLKSFLNNALKNDGLNSIQNLENIRTKLSKLRQQKKQSIKNHYNINVDKKAEMIQKLRDKDDVEPVDTIEDINHGLNDFLYQGDIMITNNQADQLLNENQRIKRQALMTTTARWPKTSPIPYVIDSSLSKIAIELVHDAINFWQNHTCLKFQENELKSPRIKFTKGEGCASYVGRVVSMKEQEISIGDRCDYFGIITHEIAHSLGIYHHQSRKDRDDYIQIALQNVPSGWEENFDTQHLTNEYGLPYEYGSSMHYAEKIFESDKIQIIAKDPKYQRTMGNRNQPTFNDIKIINQYYSCSSACKTKITCKNEGFQNPSNCSRCICPGGFGGDDCSTVAPPENGAQNCGGILNATNSWQTLVGEVGESSTIIYKRQKACHWHIQAPENKKIDIKVNYIRGPCSLGCFYGSTEIKIGNFTNTGIKLCCSSDVAINSNFKTDENIAIISAYSQLAVEKFSIQYKFI